MKNTMEIHIPIINKNHCCRDCKKKKGKMCLHWNKPIKEIALDCEPKPEWEMAEVKK